MDSVRGRPKKNMYTCDTVDDSYIYLSCAMNIYFESSNHNHNHSFMFDCQCLLICTNLLHLHGKENRTDFTVVSMYSFLTYHGFDSFHKFMFNYILPRLFENDLISMMILT